MTRILFVCTGNSCRSVMAEGLLKKMMKERLHEFSIASAGVSAMDGFPATDMTADVMKEEGVDVSAHRSRRLTLEMVQKANKIFVMEQLHREMVLRLAPEAGSKVFLLSDRMDIPDPIRMSIDFYKNVLDVIRDSLKKIVEEL